VSMAKPSANVTPATKPTTDFDGPGRPYTYGDILPLDGSIAYGGEDALVITVVKGLRARRVGRCRP
jgi:hypothetical protein